MSNKVSDLIRYYQACYALDNASLNLWNLHKIKAADRVTLTGNELLLSDQMPGAPIADEIAEPLYKRVQLYQRERQLIYACMFIAGTTEIKGEKRQLASPLVYVNVTLHQDEKGYYVTADNSEFVLNEALLAELIPQDASSTGGTHTKGKASSLSLIPGEFKAVTLADMLRASSHAIDLLPALKYPALAAKNALSKLSKQHGLALVPSAMVALIEKPKGTRGVIHELDKISACSVLSPPIRQLFETVPPSTSAVTSQADLLPGLLSNVQTQVTQIAASAPLGFVSGPPGTGKSYTIAAVAAEHMARGESVLIATSSENPLNVIADKITSQYGLKDVHVRVGSPNYLRQLKSYLNDLLSGYQPNITEQALAALTQQVVSLNEQLSRAETRLTKKNRAGVKRGQRLSSLEQRYPRLGRWYLKLARQRIRKMSQLWPLLQQIHQQQQQRESLAAQLLQQQTQWNIANLLGQSRSTLQTFNKAIRSRASATQAELFEQIDYRLLLKTFPIWLAQLNSLHRAIPNQAALFDLVIIDEATQTDIASCLPALYRAKRALIVGDDKQLRHVSFLSYAKQQAVAAKYALPSTQKGVLSYRDCSILDLAQQAINNQDHVAFLNEHFRSSAKLIDFSNQKFYRNQLKIMQQRPDHEKGEMIIHHVAGNRDSQGTNDIEAEALLNRLEVLIRDADAQQQPRSIGVLSPFRAQVEKLTAAIQSRISLDQIERFNITVATPYGFQGEERDIMLSSWVVDPLSKRAAVYLNKPDMFNVAVTRARGAHELFVSVTESELPSNLLTEYRANLRNYEAKQLESAVCDQFQQEVIHALAQHNIRCWSGVHIAGTDIDILCKYDDHYLAIDLIGFPGPWVDFFDLTTYKILKRAALDVVPISYGLWRVDSALCVEEVLNRLKNASTTVASEALTNCKIDK
ncbi:hypothetical protein EZV61_01260 [Corallincola luteus]|uniref:AAA family ATPase n=1 Tax=Corallincola luteus TaxID=1775177 RepID=A0ABY2AN56_9GAMM|nr:AAA domain-containing protein [Corallincola luteus]TCI04634.1 hypothetical protein EZV61_01260 [Corallincola luteus]